MRYSFVAAALLFSSTLALPHDKSHCKRHNKAGECEPNPFEGPGTAAGPVITGTAGPTYSGTAAASAYPSSSVKQSNGYHGTASNPLETPPDMPQGLPNKLKADAATGGDGGNDSGLPSKVKADAATGGKGGDDQCKAATVTVTSASTVTVTAGGSTAQSSAPAIAPLDTTTKQSKTDDTKAVTGGQDTTQKAAGGDTQKTTSKDTQKSTTDQGSTDQPPSRAANNNPAPVGAQSAAASSPAPKTGAKDDTTTTGATTGGTTDNTTDTTTGGGNAATGSTAGLPFKTKRGIITSGDLQDTLAAAAGVGKISWAGNWYSASPGPLSNKLTFVPQMYHTDSNQNNEWTKNSATALQGGFKGGDHTPAKYMLSFGEPGTPGAHQADPAGGVKAWNEFLAPLTKQGVKMSAPTTLQNTQDFKWLDDFLTQCTGCQVGYIAQHWFDKAAPLERQVNAIKGTLQQAKEMGAKHGIQDIWLDNFSAEGTAEEQKAFFKEILPWLDAQDWIKAYAYVPPDVGKAGSGSNFVDNKGSTTLNDLGSYYANL